jgi:hypothetical protein
VEATVFAGIVAYRLACGDEILTALTAGGLLQIISIGYVIGEITGHPFDVDL